MMIRNLLQPILIPVDQIISVVREVGVVFSKENIVRVTGQFSP